MLRYGQVHGLWSYMGISNGRACCHVWAYGVVAPPYMGIRYGRTGHIWACDLVVYPYMGIMYRDTHPVVWACDLVPPPIEDGLGPNVMVQAVQLGLAPSCSIPIYGHMIVHYTHIWPWDHALYPYMAI